MTVRVRDVLALPSLAQARLVCGHGGLDREVRRVSTVDTPVTPDDDELSAPGDFYLTGLYAVSHEPASIGAYLDDFIRTKAAAVGIIDEYVSRLPRSVIRRCEEADLPVLMIDRRVPYAAVIAEVMELVLVDRQSLLDEQRLGVLRDRTQPSALRLQALRELAPGVGPTLAVVAAAGADLRGLAAPSAVRRERRRASYLRLGDGVLVVVTDPAESSVRTPSGDPVESVVSVVRSAAKNAVIGVSSRRIPSAEAGRAVDEAAAAVVVAEALGRSRADYPALGAVRLVLALRGDPELDRFQRDLIGPLVRHDRQRHGVDLEPTVRVFLREHRNVAATARALDVHDNTVRYRLAKVRELLGEVSVSADPLDDLELAFLAQTWTEGGSSERGRHLWWL